jgi:hypothetical protein
MRFSCRAETVMAWLFAAESKNNPRVHLENVLVVVRVVVESGREIFRLDGTNGEVAPNA